MLSFTLFLNDSFGFIEVLLRDTLGGKGIIIILQLRCVIYAGEYFNAEILVFRRREFFWEWYVICGKELRKKGHTNHFIFERGWNAN